VREKYCWLVPDKPSEQGVDGEGLAHMLNVKAVLV
jgi:hypothetical protein